MRTLTPLFLLATSAACGSDVEAPPQTPPDQAPAEVGEALSASRALRDVLQVIEGVEGGAKEIRVRRIAGHFQPAAEQRPASVVLRLDLDFLAPDGLEATRLQGALVTALREREGCLAVRSDSSRTLAEVPGVYCDGFEVVLAGSGGTSLTGPAEDEALTVIRSAAVRPDIAIGQVDVKKRSWSPAEGLEWWTYEVEPSVKQAGFRIDAILGLAQSLEQAGSALVVTGIELRPSERVAPGAAAVERWSFEMRATGRAGA